MITGKQVTRGAFCNYTESARYT